MSAFPLMLIYSRYNLCLPNHVNSLFIIQTQPVPVALK